MLKKNMTIKEFFDVYFYTHEARIYGIKYDLTARTLAFKLEYKGWVKQVYEKEDRFFTVLDIVFSGVENLNIESAQLPKSAEKWINVAPRKLESIDETLLDITLDGRNTVTILTDETYYESKPRGMTPIADGITTVKFAAKTIDVIEIK